MDFDTSLLRYNLTHTVRIRPLVKVRNPVVHGTQDLHPPFRGLHPSMDTKFPRKSVARRLGHERAY